jgi:hypothetical protein
VAEAASPLLPELRPHVWAPGKRLVAAATAVAQFEKLLADFAGPTEKKRWQEELLPQLAVYVVAAQDDVGDGGLEGSKDRIESVGSRDGREGGGADSSAASAAGNTSSGSGGSSRGGGAGCALRVFAMPPAVARLRLGRQQADVFGLGAALEALTLTANSNAVRFLDDNAVALETFVHRPVWLTGL